MTSNIRVGRESKIAPKTGRYRVGQGSTVDNKGSLSNNFSVIFPSFAHLLATKPIAKQSRASGELSGGHWIE